MLAKMTVKNQITLPKSVLAQVSASDYFEIEAANDCIMLTPVRVEKTNKQAGGIESVWAKLEALGISEEDVSDAVKWARANPLSSAHRASELR